eukprot:TRINITY_DN41945_c0_g1_i1.p2 TRINITY_DN41945_c0_g1~~TRINITY_DN41945_c0_g1_i1.p2  ORF type:complete len:104 (-),score=6.82 TRINITY_DN41945_c0_g1_i1:53-364(-)
MVKTNSGRCTTVTQFLSSALPSPLAPRNHAPDGGLAVLSSCCLPLTFSSTNLSISRSPITAAIKSTSVSFSDASGDNFSCLSNVNASLYPSTSVGYNCDGSHP